MGTLLYPQTTEGERKIRATSLAFWKEGCYKPWGTGKSLNFYTVLAVRNNNEFSLRILVLQTTTTPNQPPESSTSSLTTSSPSGVVITGGTFLNAINQSKRAKSSLIWSFNHDRPKCHSHTRVAVLAEIIKWVESEAQDDLVMWLFGPPGAGKSVIAKKIAELSVGRGLLIGAFFFSGTSSTRNTKDRFIPTLAYHRTVNQDPAIFKKNIETPIDTVRIQHQLRQFHYQSWLSSTRRM